MNYHLDFLVTFLFLKVQVSDQWRAPSFISQWYDVVAMETGDIPIVHGLGEVPAKVDVQIKVIKGNEEFIFTGTGTAQRDDDYDVDFGGIVYRYNDVHVVLYTTYNGLNPVRTGKVAFTGYSTYYDGPSSARGLYTSGHARVRVWKISDFPTPLFSLNIPIKSDTIDCYKEQNHGSSILPDLVIAQVLMDDGYISEGQGNIFQESTTAHHNLLSGVVFGYNTDKVKLWVPPNIDTQYCNGVVYGHTDGWGTIHHCKSSGTVILKGYQLSKVFQTSFPAGNGILSSDTISFGKTYSLDTALVTVQVKQNGNGNGAIEDLIFNGVGSAMPTGRKYSGVVYVYTNNSALLYTPTASNTNGYMIYVGGRWGNGQSSTNSKSANVIVTVFSSPACADPTVLNTVNTLSNGLFDGSVVQYSCANGYVHACGNLTRTCSSGAWDGIDPVCTQQKCVDPGPVSNATYLYNGLSVGSTVTYICDVNFSYEAGNLERTCLSGGTWDGMPPVCLELKCNEPGSIYNATYTVTGLSPQNTANYICNHGNQQLAGDAVRTCQTDVTWSGIPIVCIGMPTGPITVPVVHTAATLAETMEQTENELRVDIKETNAYHRRHTSAYDPRPSALYIGTAGVVLLCSVVAALVLPDFITLFRHIRNFTDIYRH